VRYRIDGVLHDVMRSPRAIQSGVISRLKIMADINIAERRVPQDGRMSINASGKKIDLRVATLPTVWGEKVVMRSSTTRRRASTWPTSGSGRTTTTGSRRASPSPTE
jgi:type IV pilus assembly protein PilB